MIYTASYFEENCHHGRLISISRSEPKRIRIHDKLDFLVPSAELLRDWKSNLIDVAGYTARYREEVRQNWKSVKTWLNSLDPVEDQTLLCWEGSGIDETLKRWQETGQWREEQPFCHRNLAIKLVERYRPDCYGGRDVLLVPKLLCDSCNQPVIPALIPNPPQSPDEIPYAGAHFCPQCRSYTRNVHSAPQEGFIETPKNHRSSGRFGG